MARPRGFALLIVLWSMAAISLLATQVTSAGRTETRIAANLRAQAVAAAAADGAIEEAAFRIAARAWVPDPTLLRPLVIGGVAVRVRIEDQAGKINPNRAPRALLQALLSAAGVPVDRAARITIGIEDYRIRNQQSAFGGPKLAPYAGLPYGPAQRPYVSVDEVGLAIGMTPDILERIRPYLSTYQTQAAVASAAAPAVKQALDDTTAQAQPPGLEAARQNTILVVITAIARSNQGGTATRTATLRIQPTQPQAPVRILAWE